MIKVYSLIKGFWKVWARGVRSKQSSGYGFLSIEALMIGAYLILGSFMIRILLSRPIFGNSHTIWYITSMNSKEKVRGNVSSEVGPGTRTCHLEFMRGMCFLSRRHARVLIHETEPTADDTHGHLYHMCSRSDAKEEKNTRS